jgi:hypothetical protein
MADHSSPIQFEDVPLDVARRMGRGRRMDPQLYHELKTRIPALSSHAVHMTIPEGTSPATMKNRITRMATELKFKQGASDQNFEYRSMDFYFYTSVSTTTTPIWHATDRSNTSIRWMYYWDPEQNVWVGPISGQ